MSYDPYGDDYDEWRDYPDQLVPDPPPTPEEIARDDDWDHLMTLAGHGYYDNSKEHTQ